MYFMERKPDGHRIYVFPHNENENLYTHFSSKNSKHFIFNTTGSLLTILSARQVSLSIQKWNINGSKWPCQFTPDVFG